MQRTTPYLKVTFSVIAWGASFVATKVALIEVSPVAVVWLRFGIGILILAGIVYSRKQLQFPPFKDLAYFALLGFLGITFHQWLQSTGLVTARATTTAWIVATTPIFITILGWLILSERLKWEAVGGILAAAFGVILVVTKGNLVSLNIGQFGDPGDLLILISAPNWAVFSVLSRRGLKTHPAARMILYVMIFGWLGTTVQFFIGPGINELRQLSLNGWIAVTFLGIAASGLAYVFWFDGLEKLQVSQVGVFLYLEPLATMLIASAVLGEHIQGITLLGGLIILTGVWLVNRSRILYELK
jgi:drug/metabolite transporter (DMT)-like permease